MKNVLSMGLIIATSFLVGCGFSNNVKADDRGNFSMVSEGSERATFSIYKDNETGVHYVIAWLISSSGISIYPRYNADGSLYVD